MQNQIIDLLGFKEEIVEGIHVDIARCRSCSQKARPLPKTNTNLKNMTLSTFLTFICPCIASISLKHSQQDATFT